MKIYRFFNKGGYYWLKDPCCTLKDMNLFTSTYRSPYYINFFEFDKGQYDI